MKCRCGWEFVCEACRHADEERLNAQVKEVADERDAINDRLNVALRKIDTLELALARRIPIEELTAAVRQLEGVTGLIRRELDAFLADAN